MIKNIIFLITFILCYSSCVWAEGPEVVWAKTFGGDSDSVGDSVQQTSDGGFIISGIIESYYGGDWDAYLVKTDSQGDKQWERVFEGSGDNYGNSVQQTSDGGYVIAGHNSGNAYLIKTDSQGSQQWKKTFGGGSSP